MQVLCDRDRPICGICEVFVVVWWKVEEEEGRGEGGGKTPAFCGSPVSVSLDRRSKQLSHATAYLDSSPLFVSRSYSASLLSASAVNDLSG